MVHIFGYQLSMLRRWRFLIVGVVISCSTVSITYASPKKLLTKDYWQIATATFTDSGSKRSIVKRSVKCIRPKLDKLGRPSTSILYPGRSLIVKSGHKRVTVYQKDAVLVRNKNAVAACKQKTVELNSLIPDPSKLCPTFRDISVPIQTSATQHLSLSALSQSGVPSGAILSITAADSGAVGTVGNNGVDVTGLQAGIHSLVLQCSVSGSSSSATITLLSTPSLIGQTPRHITMATRTVEADSVFTLIGSFAEPLVSQVQAWMDPGDGTLISLEVVQRRANAMQVRSPKGVNKAPWKVFLSAGDVYTNSVYLNNPEIKVVSSSYISPHGALTVYGKNLSLQGVAPSVTLKSVIDGSLLPMNVEEFSEYRLRIRAPLSASITDDTKYQIVISTTDALADSAGIADVVLTGIASSSDPLGLDVPWASKLAYLSDATKVYNIKADSRLTVHAVGDGVTNDNTALTQAVNYITIHGGGILYVPAGTYRNAGDQIYVNPNVLVRGAGADKTTITFGEYGTCPTQGKICPANGFRFVAQNTGIMDLTLQNKNATTSNNYAYATQAGQDCHTSFIKNVVITTAFGGQTNFLGCSNVLVQNLTATTTSSNGANIGFGYVTFSSFLNNEETHALGRVGFITSSNLVVEGNKFHRLGQFATVGESGGVESSYTEGIGFGNNYMDITGTSLAPPANGNGSGESFMSQQSNYPQYTTDSTITDADATSLTDTVINSEQLPVGHMAWTTIPEAFNFGARYLFFPKKGDYLARRSIVHIIDGQGMGQWREIVDYTDTKITIDRPWDIIPQPGDTYSISAFTAKDQFVIGNSFVNQALPIEFWDGAIDNIVANNNFNNSIGGFFRCSESGGYAGGGYSSTEKLLFPCWGNSFIGNYIATSVTDKNSSIAIFPDRFGVAHIAEGVAVMNSIQDNMIVGGYLAGWHPFSGIRNYSYIEGEHDITPVENIGSIISNNTCSGFPAGTCWAPPTLSEDYRTSPNAVALVSASNNISQ